MNVLVKVRRFGFKVKISASRSIGARVKVEGLRFIGVGLKVYGPKWWVVRINTK